MFPLLHSKILLIFFLNIFREVVYIPYVLGNVSHVFDYNIRAETKS